MKPIIKPNEVLVIDKLEHWRNLSQTALGLAGFRVRALGNYDCPLVSETRKVSPDLVILGCGRIGSEELQLIERVHCSKVHLLVLCTSLRWQVMRSLFLLGADDVAEKPFDSIHLLYVVGQTLESISLRHRHSSFRMTTQHE